MSSHPTPARDYFPGIGKSVADRTVNRTILETDNDAVGFDFLIDDPGQLDATLRAAYSNYVLYDEAVDGVKPYTIDSIEAPIVTRELSTIIEGSTKFRIKGWFLPKGKKRVENWSDVAARVAHGNSLLDPRGYFAQADERYDMEHHLRQASLLMSGRHLQHGDKTQPTRNAELFTNCSTAATRHLLFELLLNGSGVGTLYADAICDVVDFNHMPIVVPVIDWNHADVKSGEIRGYLTIRDAEHLYRHKRGTTYKVPDTREGWAEAIRLIDTMTYKRHRDHVLILDFSLVRPRGAPIKGMQNRPASGPAPLMGAIAKVAALRDAGMDAWRAAMYADHYLAECVLVGGARRAARMAVKPWDDEATIFDFIELKRGGFLWSSNNSIGVTQEFWSGVKAVEDAIVSGDIEMQGTGRATWPVYAERPVGDRDVTLDSRQLHAWRVFQAATKAAYEDNTGEPGFINVDRLNDNRTGLEDYINDGTFVDRAGLDDLTKSLYRDLATRVRNMKYPFIVNPCAEIVLNSLGGYCVIADVVPFHAQNDADAEDAFRVATRALIRTNLMDCLYSKEVKRTNRIGVGITGFHEWVWNRFGLSFRDIIEVDPSGRFIPDAFGRPIAAPTPKAMEMWLKLEDFAFAVSDEAERYANELGVTVPHTNRTVKPAGTTSKLFGLSEGVHLPTMREYLRWVQYRNDDPLIDDLKAAGYPTKKLQHYSGTTVVGFPTRPVICTLGMGDKLVTASEATPAEQYRFLQLLERFWIRGSMGEPDTGNQISYTLKYDPAVVDLAAFQKIIMDQQSRIKCCSFMPMVDTSAYEYLPESPVTKDEFERIAEAIKSADVQEDIGIEHIDCASGACPTDFAETKAG